MPGRRPSGVRPVYAACPISPISPISPASSGGRGAVGKVFSRLNPFSVFLPLWAGRGCPGGDARTTFPYFGSRKHPVLPGRVQRRRPVRVLPRRRTAEGGLPFPPPRVQCRFAFGGLMRNISSKEEAVFSPGRVQRRRPVRVLPRRRTAEGGLPFPPPRVQCRFAFGGLMRNISSKEEAVFSPGRVQRRRPVRVLPRRRTAEGGLPFPPPRVQCRFAFGEGRCGYILGRRSCFSPGRAQSRGLSDRIEEREATARTSRFFVSVPAADAACGARPGRVASAAGGCGRTARRAALRESADA